MISAADSPPLPWPTGATFRQRVCAFLKVSPLVTLAIYTVLSLVIKENYPFSHYPMYSKPSAADLHIQFLADGEGKPLPVAWHTGVTGSKVAKLQANRMKKHNNEKRIYSMP